MLTRDCYLIDGMWDTVGTKGTLTFDPDTRRLRFTLTDLRKTRWLEKRLGAALHEQVKAGATPLVFDIPIDDREVKWPRNFGGRVMKVDDGTHTWTVSLTIPGGMSYLLFGGKEASEPWKEAFASARVA
jgi:hypothetical protein